VSYLVHCVSPLYSAFPKIRPRSFREAQNAFYKSRCITIQ
jgi:hypothetical protein